MKLSSARAIVTGAARGLGRHFALALLREGAGVVGGDIDPGGLRSLMAEAAGLPGSLTTLEVDITAEAAVKEFVKAASRSLPGLNALINNAGILRDGVLATKDPAGVRGMPLSMWSKILNTNLTGQFLMAREVVCVMLESGTPGVVVNVSSLARAGNPGQSNYAASKAGLDACTRTWALELARAGIRVGGVAPGVIDTPILEGISETALAALLAAIPLGRFGTAEEVWQAVSFILTCEFFTGRTIEIDGGASMG
ncbi:MAG TPA: SDR family oxidoreductase [Thermoanaerobaculia bacterium]|nr:SDR family oxidoreductase [Thermoanaerobaculia bacterium]